MKVNYNLLDCDLYRNNFKGTYKVFKFYYLIFVIMYMIQLNGLHIIHDITLQVHGFFFGV